MARPRASRIVGLVVVVVLVVVLVAAASTVLVVLRRPLPTTSGTLDLPALAADVTVTRDGLGVPTIEASTPADLFRAQGFVDAQDRFFLMDYRRHVTAGRLSELVGANEDALAADKVVRTMGWRRVAEQEWGLLAPATREAFQAYADGVNAYLAGRAPGAIAMEYAVLGFQVQVGTPEPWDPVDSVAWLKAMAWDLRSNYDDELERALAYQGVGDVRRVDELFPPYPEDQNLPILPEAADETLTPAAAAGEPLDLADPGLQAALAATDHALAAIPDLVGTDDGGTGSNSWVVSGEHTASGAPLLANDPHLSISAPGVWSQVGLRCAPVGDACPYDVAGFSFAGMPGVVIGHNERLAWGLTNLGPDVADFFLERITADAQEVDGEPVLLQTREETIHVNGAADVPLTVRTTTHGPLVSDVMSGLAPVGDAPADGEDGGGYAVSLAWTALRPGRTADALLQFATARDAADIAAAAEAFEVPAQNIVFATVDGHIGYQAPGRVPVRDEIAGPVPSDGSWPRPGWDSRYDWDGWVPPAQLPHALDPDEGFIVAANQAVTRAGVGPFLTDDWDYGYRSQEIRDQLARQISSGEPITVADAGRLQLDQHSPYADVLVPALLDVPLTGFDADGQDLLRGWDREMSEDSAAAAYFAAVWVNVLELTFADDLPADHGPDGGSRWLEVVRQIVDRPDSPWWDDRSTPGIVEGRDDVLERALVSARRELTAQLGSRPEQWRWAMLHVAAPEHPVLGGSSVPALVRERVNPHARGVGGGPSIVDATSWNASSGSYAVTAAPSMRMVVDLGNLDSSTWVNLTGTSGHPASRHYADQFEAWSTGRTFPWPFSAAATEADAADRLTLRPAS